MQVYDGLPILTNRSPHSERLVGIWPLDARGVGRGVRAARARARSTRSSRHGRTPVVAGGTGLYFRAALAELELPPAPAPGDARTVGAALRRGTAQRAAHARLCASSTRPRRRASIRTTGDESFARSSSRTPGLPRTRGGRAVRRRLAASDRSSSGSTSRRRSSSDASRNGRGACSTPESRTKCGTRSGRAVRDRAEGHRPRRSRDAPAGGGDRVADRPHAALRRVPAQVDATPRRSRYGRGRPSSGGDRS